jgi:hypothetical protein
LPHLEQPALYKRIDWRIEPGNFGPRNERIRAIELELLHCPSDEKSTPVEGYAPTNYVACIGHTDLAMWLEVEKRHRGAFGINSRTTFADIRDGTSNTMLVSECLVGEPSVQLYFDDRDNYLDCLARDPRDRPPDPTDPRAFSWFFARRNQAWTYSTWLLPNDRVYAPYECEWYPRQGAFGARSRHPAGVNVVLADGEVQFKSENIDAYVWKSLGTRTGDELPPETTP